MKLSFLLLGISMSAAMTTTVALKNADAQLLDVKPWHGTYPEMKGSYPLSFVSFKGWLFPTPHFFVRAYPSYYYVKVGALPVSDGTEYAGQTKTGLLRLAARLLEKSKVQGRMDETSQIRENKQLRQAINQKLFDSRKEELPDIYDLAGHFISLYRQIEKLDQLEKAGQVKTVLQKEADALLYRFIRVNLLETDHGSKLEAFAGIKKELGKLAGETDYTYQKIRYFNFYVRDSSVGYAFLAR